MTTGRDRDQKTLIPTQTTKQPQKHILYVYHILYIVVVLYIAQIGVNLQTNISLVVSNRT